MEKIYKYTSLESAIKILESNAVALNNPQNYNDPFDSVIDFDDGDIEKSISIVVEYYLIQEFLKLLNNKNIKVGFLTKLIMKWARFGINLYLKVSKRNKYYDSIPGAQALTKFVVRYAAQKGENSFEELKEKFTNEIIRKVKDARNNALISCFSKRYDSILMWSHYGDKHKGICIEFDRPENDFLDVKYSKKRCKFDLEDTTRRVLGYMLSNEEVDVNDKGLIRCISKPFIVKSLDWKYEEEVRCVLSPNSEGVSTLEELSLYKMPTNISKIYIGCKVDKTSEEYKNLITLANNKNVMILELKTSDDLFSVIEE
ncbi:putative uncharacterized protein [Firmicutes bacterium CAG:631]|nr:putative uncharacterized protein [Firmicutes bacterium CAG:631]